MSESLTEYSVFEEMDIKPDIDDSHPPEELNNLLGGCDGHEPVGAQTLPEIQIQQRLHIIEARLDDIEEKIDQKFQTMIRKQDKCFALIARKLDMTLSSLNHKRPSTATFNPTAPKRMALSNNNVVIPHKSETVESPLLEEILPKSHQPAPKKVIHHPVKLRLVADPTKSTFNIELNPEEILRCRPLVKTVSDMKDFETNLLIPSYRQSVLTNIKMIGGNSMTSEIGNIVKSLLSNTVQANYSFKGARGKICFNLTNTWDVIRQCVQERYPGTTVDQVKKGVSDYLRNAPGKLRMKGD